MSEHQDDQPGNDQAGTDPIDTGQSSTGQSSTDADALLSRLRVIEDQPLEARAAAFSQIHDELQSNLESEDPTRSRG